MDHLPQQFVGGGQLGRKGEVCLIGAGGAKVKIPLEGDGGAAHLGLGVPLQVGWGGHGFPGE